MGWLDAPTVEWWLPAGYLLVAALVEILWTARNDESAAANKVDDADDADSISAANRGLRAPLLRESSGEARCVEAKWVLVYVCVRWKRAAMKKYGFFLRLLVAYGARLAFHQLALYPATIDIAPWPCWGCCQIGTSGTMYTSINCNTVRLRTWNA